MHCCLSAFTEAIGLACQSLQHESMVFERSRRGANYTVLLLELLGHITCKGEADCSSEYSLTRRPMKMLTPDAPHPVVSCQAHFCTGQTRPELL